jgi:lipid-binding SYLF domain-containing protein
MRRARVLAVFPGSVGEASCYTGLGIASARDIVNGNWTAPATMAFEGRIPVSLDVTNVDFIFVALTPRGADYFRAAQSSLAAGDVIAPGPLGQNTRIDMNTDVLAYMQFGDFFAGITVEEFSLREMNDVNARLYGIPYSTADVWRGGLRRPVAAEIWRAALQSYFRETS